MPLTKLSWSESIDGRIRHRFFWRGCCSLHTIQFLNGSPMRTISAALTVVMLALLPLAAAAATVQDIVALSRAGVSDKVILALIERDQTIFSLDSGQIADLQNEGLSEDVILAMLRSGRQQPPAATAAEVPSMVPSVPPLIPPLPDNAS